MIKRVREGERQRQSSPLPSHMKGRGYATGRRNHVFLARHSRRRRAAARPGGEGERHPHAQGGGQHAQEEDGEAREGDAVQHSVAVDDLDAGTRPKSRVQGDH
jgi:hypothetical protein